MPSAKCWSLLVGSRRLAQKRPTFSARDERLLQRITTKHFPAGYSILHAAGGWFDSAAGRFVREESRQVLICSATEAAVRAWGRELGAALHQRELLIVELGRALTLEIRSNSRRSRARSPAA